MKTAIKAIQCTAIVLLALAVIAVNIVCGFMNEWLTTFFGGRGLSSGSAVTRESADELVQEIEGEGVILLKNEGNALPLTGTTKLNVFGWSSTEAGFIMSGSGSGDSGERGGGAVEPTNFLEGLEKAGFETNKELTDIYTQFKDKKDGNGKSLEDPSDVFFKLYEPARSVYTESVMTQAKNFSDTALIVISRSGGEGQDLPGYQTSAQGTDRATSGVDKDTSRSYLEISSREQDLIDVVTDAGFAKVIVVINTVNAMELGFLDDEGIDAAISVGGPGQSGCIAIADVLRGEITPSGRTVDTYAYDLTTAPSFINAADWGVEQYNGFNADEYTPNSSTPESSYIDYVEGIYVGYKWYETADAEGFWDSELAKSTWGIANGYEDVVQYPFGYGLSYAEFAWTVKEVSPARGAALAKDGKIEVTVTVTNTSETYAGKDVVELYYTPEYDGGAEMSAVNLAAYAKTPLLQPGESEDVTLTLSVSDMKTYDCYGANDNGHTGYELIAGDYTLSLRTDAHTVAACDGSVIDYTVAEDIFYDEDTATGNPVQNRFTGEDAYGGASIDGFTSGEGITYLTRTDFASTFPFTRRATRDKTEKVRALGNSWYEKNEIAEMPETGSERTAYKLTENGEWNEELVMELGSDYESEKWADVIAQITQKELISLVEDAGFKTERVSSVGKPKAIDLDGPAGLNSNIGGLGTLAGDNAWTIYPVEIVLASSWNDELAHRFGQMVGTEAAESNVSGWYAPGANLHRSPFGGRNFEYYSEDALLSGKMCANVVSGCLSKGLYPYMKHFAVNETEEQRSGLYTWLSEQALREIYLRPFEIAVKEGNANAIMTSFNRIGAIWAGGNKALLEDLVRGEWGFCGTMLTDWSSGGSYMNLDQGLATGTDAWLNGANSLVFGHDDKNSKEGVSDMQRAAKNILYTYCNTYYQAQTYGDGMGIKITEDVFPVWIFILVGIDVVAVAGLGTWTYFLFFRRKKAKEA